jgi:phage head maturation protease
MPPTIERRAERPAAGVRQAPFKLRSADGATGDGWTLDGYGAVFNRLTTIDSWEGVFREKLANRSMTKSFRESPPIVQFDHGRHPLIGSIPVGELVSAREEVDPELAPDGGAHVIANMSRNWLIEPLRDAIAAQAIKGMSFRFEVVREKWETFDGKTIKNDEELMKVLRETWSGDVPEAELPIRTLQEVRVPEIGPVVWPAYVDTSVGVRSRIIDLGRLKRNDPQQRKLLARAVFIADEAERKDDGGELDTRATDADDDAAALAGALDATLDEAVELVSGVDFATLPPDVAQALNLLVAAETTADALLEAMGIDDPDDDEADETNSAEKTSGAPRSTEPKGSAGKHSPTKNDAPQTTRDPDQSRAGEHPSKPKEPAQHKLSQSDIAEVMQRTRAVLLEHPRKENT